MSKKRLVKIALGQFASKHGDAKANLNRMLGMADEAAAAGADLVIFPELAYSGYFCNSATMQQLAEPSDGHFVQELCRKAKEKGLHIIAGYPESCEISGRIYNSLIFIDDNGKVIENMRKVYLWAREKQIFREGNRFPVVKTKFGKVGLLVCADLEYPEPSRLEALKGAEMIVDCSVWSINPAEHRWHVAMQANAMFNLLFTVGCNTVGENLCGSSMVVGPDGLTRIVASRTEEELLITEIDLSEVLEVRSRIPYLNDFKNDTFSIDAIERY